MKLIFDCRFIRVEHHDGISRFSIELFRALSSRVETIALISDLRQLRWLPESARYLVGNDPTKAFSELNLPQKLNEAGATHVFSPMQTMGTLGRKYKLILTLHDLIYYDHPTAPPALPLHVRIVWRIYHTNFWAARRLLNRADAVVTVSETSKQRIGKHKLTTKPVHVVYNAPNSTAADLLSQTPKTLGSRRQLVYMGSFMSYKNVECLVRGMRSLPDHELVLLSRISPSRRNELETLAGAARQQIIFRNGVSDTEYAQALDDAFALVSASKDEGFGIPLVEAMAQAIPLVVSDVPIFREVAKEAGRYFDPLDTEAFVSCVKNLSDSKAWDSASTAAKKRATSFNWDESASVLLKALEAL